MRVEALAIGCSLETLARSMKSPGKLFSQYGNVSHSLLIAESVDRD